MSVPAGPVPLIPNRLWSLIASALWPQPDSSIAWAIVIAAGMPWIVKHEKDDFVGKWAVKLVEEQGVRERLVGFTMADGYVPTEGSVIIDAVGDPAGQVTSARFSPVLDRVIGMAWVPSPLARDGSPITTGVPFTVTVATPVGGTPTLGLVLGATTLPSASVSAGSLRVK